MAKKRKVSNKKKAPTGKRSRSKKKAVQSKEAKLPQNYLFSLPPYADGGVRHTTRWKRIFYGATLAIGLVLLMQAWSTGMNSDESFHTKYEPNLIAFYTSAGKDTKNLKSDDHNMHLSGKFFDITTGLISRTLGYNPPDDTGYWKVRHLINALLGFLIIFMGGMLAKELGGWPTGLMALLFLFLSPRLMGHAVMNPRDIPYAAGYMTALFFFFKLIRSLPKPGWKVLVGFALGIGLITAARTAGMILFVGISGLFLGTHFLLMVRKEGTGQAPSLIQSYARNYLLSLAGGLIFGYLFWPYGLLHPVEAVRESFTQASNFTTNIRMLFAGELVWANELPLFKYISTWFLIAQPLYLIVGMGLFLGLGAWIFRKYSVFGLALIAFAALFPVAYIIYKGSTLYDGQRHLTFIYPCLMILAAVAWSYLLISFREKKPVFWGLAGVLALMMIEPAIHTVRNLPYNYVYFNPLAGGLKGTFGEYEQDYWGLSTKQAIDWMKEEGIFEKASTEDPVVVTTNFSYPVRRYLAELEKEGKIKLMYTRFRQRYDKEWDYGIYIGRFVDPGQLKSGYWPSDKAVHSVKAGGVPLCIVLKSDSEKYAYRGQEALQAGNYQEAIELLEKEVAAYQDNEIAWANLGNAYLSTNQGDKAQNAFENALRVNPDYGTVYNYYGMALMRSNQLEPAKEKFQKAVELNTRNSFAWYYLASINAQQNQLNLAIEQVQKAIQSNPKFKAAYELAANIYEQLGNSSAADQYRAAAGKL